MGSVTWSLLDKNKEQERLLGYLTTHEPKWDRETIIFGYWFWGSLALRNHSSTRDGKWTSWRKGLTRILLDHQDPSGAWILPENVESYEYEGGDAYTTAMGVLTLNVPGFLPSVFEW